MGNVNTSTLRLIEGTVVEITESSVTVKTNNGQTKILNEKRLKKWKTKKPELETTISGVVRLKTKDK